MGLEDLPTELVHRICALLSFNDLKSVALVSSRLADLATSPRLWENFDCDGFAISKQGLKHYLRVLQLPRSVYIECSDYKSLILMSYSKVWEASPHRGDGHPAVGGDMQRRQAASVPHSPHLSALPLLASPHQSPLISPSGCCSHTGCACHP